MTSRPSRQLRGHYRAEAPPQTVATLADRGKIVTAEEAVKLIKDGDTITASGIGGQGFPEKIMAALEARFLSTGEPRNLTQIDPCPTGTGLGSGIEHMAHEGLLKRIIESSFWNYPKLRDLITENKIEAYAIPLGGAHNLIHETGAGRPYITKTGLYTNFDPRYGGGHLNSRTKEDIVKVVSIDGDEYMFYKPYPINVAIVRGWMVDPDGNLSFEGEPLTLGGVRQAMAAKASGGKVIVQAKYLVARGFLTARQVNIPSFFVDAVVIDPQQPQNYANPATDSAGQRDTMKAPIPQLGEIPLNHEKVMARRAAMEVRPGQMLNFGGGTPGWALPGVLLEEGVQDLVTCTVEHGNWGGVMYGFREPMINLTYLPDYDDVFSFYNGGALDLAFLGFGQVDRDGNVNETIFNDVWSGVGGSLDISFNAKKVVFMGPFTAGGKELIVSDGKMSVIKQGTIPKVIEKVEWNSISSVFLKKQREGVLYVTERCVFRLTPEGIELAEVAPGLDVEKDIIQQMGFRPKISKDFRTMDERIFRPEKMGLREELLKGVPRAPSPRR